MRHILAGHIHRRVFVAGFSGLAAAGLAIGACRAAPAPVPCRLGPAQPRRPSASGWTGRSETTRPTTSVSTRPLFPDQQAGGEPERCGARAARRARCALAYGRARSRSSTVTRGASTPTAPIFSSSTRPVARRGAPTTTPTAELFINAARASSRSISHRPGSGGDLRVDGRAGLPVDRALGPHRCGEPSAAMPTALHRRALVRARISPASPLAPRLGE